MADITPAGRKLIADYLARWASVRDNPRGGALKLCVDMRNDNEVVLCMPLPPGDGACAAAARKLIREGFARGQYSWTQGRYLTVTNAGVEAFLKQQPETPTGRALPSSAPTMMEK